MTDLRQVRNNLKTGNYDGTDIMAAWIAIDELLVLREHRCEVGMENPDTFLKHLQSLSPSEREELRNITNPRY